MNFDPQLLVVQRDALAELKSFPPTPTHLAPPAVRLRAILIEILQQIGRNGGPDRWPPVGHLLKEADALATALGYPNPPLRVVAQEKPAARRGVDHPTDGEPFFWIELHWFEPALGGRGATVLERLYHIDDQSSWSDRPLGRTAEYLRTIVEVLLRWVRHLDLPPASPPPNDQVEPTANNDFDDAAYMTSAEIAARLGLDHDPVRKRLDRWRQNHFDGYHEVANPRAGDPKYVYQIRVIRPVLDGLRATAKRPPRDRAASESAQNSGKKKRPSR